MFLNKWTIQVIQPGQIEELSFDSRDEAMQYADRLLVPEANDQEISLTLIDPASLRTVISGSENKHLTAGA